MLSVKRYALLSGIGLALMSGLAACGNGNNVVPTVSSAGSVGGAYGACAYGQTYFANGYGGCVAGYVYSGGQCVCNGYGGAYGGGAYGNGCSYYNGQYICNGGNYGYGNGYGNGVCPAGTYYRPSYGRCI